MHIFFSGIGGGGVGPLALIARQAGYEVSGSDAVESTYTQKLREQGVNLYIGQTTEEIAAEHAKHPIDWLVYSSASTKDHPEIMFAKAHNITLSKRDELLNKIIADHKLKLIAIAGTHGKTTTTAMVIWLLQQLGVPLSYSVGTKISFGPSGYFDASSTYFVYECDEFDRNFLAFEPYLSLITGIGWDHHEIFPTQENYNEAFRTFIAQSQHSLLWDEDVAKLKLPRNKITVLESQDSRINDIRLPGEFNRQDAWQAVQAVHRLTGTTVEALIVHIDTFPGLAQRMEELAPHLFSNYAHTPEKIRGGMQTALDIAATTSQNVVILYEPLTNRRQHYIADDYKDCFAGATKIYWLPTYLAREDPKLPILTPEQLIPHISNAHVAEPAKFDDDLLRHIRKHLQAGDMVVGMGASGAGSLDEWLRKNLTEITHA